MENDQKWLLADKGKDAAGLEGNPELHLPDTALAAHHFAMDSVLQVSQAGFVRRGNLFFWTK